MALSPRPHLADFTWLLAFLGPVPEPLPSQGSPRVPRGRPTLTSTQGLDWVGLDMPSWLDWEFLKGVVGVSSGAASALSTWPDREKMLEAACQVSGWRPQGHRSPAKLA